MSAQKSRQALLVAALILVAIGLLALFPPQAAVAQCGEPKPSCVTCHAKVQPVLQGEWHIIHEREECCRSCHGGNDQAQDKGAAHVSLVLNPLTDTYTSCHQCHPDDYRQRAERFAMALHITPVSSEPITQAVAFQPPSSVPPFKLPVAATLTVATGTTPWLWALIFIVAVTMIGLAVLWRKLSRG